jgi:Holliday junction resolvase RusA-like endonuclease
MKYSFEFDIKPISKDNEKICNSKGRFFLSQKFKNFEEEIKWNTIKQLTGKYKGFKLLEGSLRVGIWFHFTDNHRRDLFNLPKSICDALNRVVYKDDSQIVAGHIYKLAYAESDKIILEIEELDAENQSSR